MTDTPTPDPIAQQLMQHAQMLARLRHDLDQLASDVTDTTADLIGRLDDVSVSSRVGARTPTAWCWRDLGSTAQAELWAELSAWVGWVRTRYPLARKIPPCWAEHPETVEELTALWLAWQYAYEHGDAPLTAAADWHDRWLPGVLHRLEHGPFALDCQGEHHLRPPATYAESLGRQHRHENAT